MGGALNQARAVIEKPVRLPLKWNGSVRTAVAIDEHLAIAADRQQAKPVDIKAATLCFWQ